MVARGGKRGIADRWSRRWLRQGRYIRSPSVGRWSWGFTFTDRGSEGSRRPAKEGKERRREACRVTKRGETRRKSREADSSVGIGVGRRLPKVNDLIVRDRRALGEEEGAGVCRLDLIRSDARTSSTQNRRRTQETEAAEARVGWKTPVSILVAVLLATWSVRRWRGWESHHNATG